MICVVKPGLQEPPYAMLTEKADADPVDVSAPQCLGRLTEDEMFYMESLESLTVMKRKPDVIVCRLFPKMLDDWREVAAVVVEPFDCPVVFELEREIGSIPYTGHPNRQAERMEDMRDYWSHNRSDHVRLMHFSPSHVGTLKAFFPGIHAFAFSNIYDIESIRKHQTRENTGVIVTPYPRNRNIRNAWQSAVVAEHLAARYDAEVLALGNPMMADSEAFPRTKHLGRLNGENYIELLAEASLVVNLESGPTHGRVAKDCAALKTPFLGASGPTFNQVWHDTGWGDAFDTAARIQTGKFAYSNAVEAKRAHDRIRQFDFRLGKARFRELVGVDHA